MLHLELAQPGEAALIALAPRGDATGQPVLLVLEMGGHALQLALVLLLNLFSPLIELHIAFRAFQHLALTQPQRVGGDVLQEAPVMAHHQNNAVKALQPAFQIFDHRHVEMVGRLVQQEDRRLLRKCLGQRGAPHLPARQCLRVRRRINPELHQLGLGHVGRVQPVARIVEHGGIARKIGLLRDIRKSHPRLAPHLAGIRLGGLRDDLHQRGFARAIAADQRRPLAFRQRQRHPLEQGCIAKGEAHIGKRNQGRLSHSAEIAARRLWR